MAFVEFRDVRKTYRMGEVEVAAVDGMTFDIEEGELVVVVGPSGAGKTTLLNMLGGMDGATSGTIVLDGRRVSSFDTKELTYYRRYDIGFVFQFYNLVQNLTALENVELASQICKDPLDAADVLRQVGLGHRLDNFPAQLSGGEQQMLAIARGLMANPEIIMLDEPSLGLAPLIVNDIIRIIQEINRKGVSVLLVEQNAKKALAIADRACVLEQGRIVKRGSGKELAADESIIQSYLGGK